MKLKLKMMAIAAALASLAGGAQAAVITTATNNGTFALTVFNTQTKTWYIRDLGYTINTFLPSGVLGSVGAPASLAVGDKTPELGLTLNASNTTNFADASWSSWYSAQNSTDLRWFVSAGDTQSAGVGNVNGTTRIVVSSTNSSINMLPAETASNGQVGNFIGSSNYGAIGSLFGSGNQLSQSSTDGVNFPYQSSFDTLLLLGGDGLANIGQDAGLFYFARVVGGQSGSAANGGAFSNSAFAAVVSLAANGDFSYTQPPAAVPLPAAAWLMGAGLIAMGGMIRRRKAAAQA